MKMGRYWVLTWKDRVDIVKGESATHAKTMRHNNMVPLGIAVEQKAPNRQAYPKPSKNDPSKCETTDGE